MNLYRNLVFILLLLISLTSCEENPKSNVSKIIHKKDKVKAQTGAKSSEEKSETIEKRNIRDVKAEKAILKGDISKAVSSYVEPPSQIEDCVTIHSVIAPIDETEATEQKIASEDKAPTEDKVVTEQKPKTEEKLASEETCKDRYFQKKVLYIGDSHSFLRSTKGNRMGNFVANKVKSCGSSAFHYRGVCGTRPKHWTSGRWIKTSCGYSSMDPKGFKSSSKGKAKSLRALSDLTKADHVIINLGDNMFNWKRSSSGQKVSYIARPDKIVSEVKNLLKDLSSNQKCTWIGPTYHAPGRSYHKRSEHIDQMYTAIEKGIDGRCRLIDSRPFFKRKNGTKPNDGLHLMNSESGKWGKRLAKII